MNGVHDLGGMHGFGPVSPEPNEPLFHAEWEKRAFALFFGCFAAGQYDVDRFRQGIEKMDPAHYLASPYYAHWVHTVQMAIVENGVVTDQDIEDRMAQLAKEAH